MNSPASPAAPRKGPSTLVIVLAIVFGVLILAVAVIGVLAALAISGVRQYVSKAKTAEANAELLTMARGAIAAAARERMPETLAPNGQASLASQLPPSSRPVPTDVPRGIKYMSGSSDWEGPGWDELKFEIFSPQYFQYQWVRLSDVSGECVARGDLDGDGVAESHFVVAIRCTNSSGSLDCTAGPVEERP